MLTDLKILNLLAENFDSVFSGKKFHTGFTFRKSELLMIFGKKEPITLFFNAAKNEPYIYFKEGNFKPKRKQVVELFKGLNGLELLSIKGSLTNRELSLLFEKGVSLKFVLFGYQPNALLLNDENEIIDSFKSSSKLKGRNYGEEFPPLKRTQVTNSSILKQIFRGNPSVKLSRALRNSFYSLDQTSAREIAFLSDISYDHKSHEIDDGSIKRIWKAYKKVTAANSSPEPTVYRTTPPLLTLFKPGHLDGVWHISFDSANDAVTEFIILQNSYTTLSAKKTETRKSLRLKLNSLRERTKKQKIDLTELKDRQDWHKIGDVLMSNLHNIKTGMTEISLSDFDGNEMVVKLNNNLSPASNAQYYYKKAKSAHSGEKKLLRAIRTGEKIIPELTDLVEKLESVNTLKEWDLFEKNFLKKQLPVIRSNRQKQDAPSLPYREFDAPQGYTAYVGKSAKDNDKLTFKIGKKNDLWLHVQGAQGSHVVVPALKKGVPFPRDVIVFAAQLAARHSKQKHSGIVPVIYTQCKYVWKKKGGPPGTVHIKNEKSIMVKPGL
ncbi:DUF814 domain-containing protein [Candidatus Marinimicrobia bacterium MT.SAG.3]|nr:DUF814 domain-containing protein [Candidatus Marinimicrobia bacterium MT.SAG.3]